MLTEKFNELITVASPENMAKALTLLFAPHASPVFGASKTIEHEVAALDALKLLGYLTQNSDEFELVEKLRVTKSKARSLLYQSALRKNSNTDTVEQELRAILTNPRLAAEGDFYLIEVPQPLTMDRLRHRIRQLGFLSDGSFSGSIARIKRPALAALISSLIPETEQQIVIKELIRAGYQGTDTQAIITAMLKKAGSKIAGDVGGELAGYLGESIDALFNQIWDRFRDV
jgi:SOS response regulatory protein OraA/RecX